MTSFVEPLIQELETQPTLSPGSIAALNALAQSQTLRKHVLEIKIWRPDGTVVFSTLPEIIGQKFEVDEISEPLKGNISAYLDDLDDEENVLERQFQQPIYEVYAPLRSKRTNDVIAVGEFYEDATALESELFFAVRESWLVAASVGAIVLFILYLIVNRGTNVIATQAAELKRLKSEREKLKADNQQVAQQIDTASRTLGELEERLKRRIGLELHDGPTQLISYILMNLDEIRQITENASGGVTEDSQHLLAELRAAAEDALIDIRDISTSLVRGPNEDEFRQSLSLEARIAAHERRTGLPVGRVGLQCLQDIPEQIVEVVIQVVREALTNGHKHARGSAQSVIAQREGNFLLVKVVDGGLARGRVSQEPPFPGGGGLGLSGMRYRAESIGGSMEVVREEGKGATISFKFPLPGTTGGDAEET